MGQLLELLAIFRVGQDLWGQTQSMLTIHFPKTLEQEMGANSWSWVFLSQSALPCPELQIGILLFHCTMGLFTVCGSILWLVTSSLIRPDRDVYFIKAYPP